MADTSWPAPLTAGLPAPGAPCPPRQAQPRPRLFRASSLRLPGPVMASNCSLVIQSRVLLRLLLYDVHRAGTWPGLALLGLLDYRLLAEPHPAAAWLSGPQCLAARSSSSPPQCGNISRRGLLPPFLSVVLHSTSDTSVAMEWIRDLSLDQVLLCQN